MARAIVLGCGTSHGVPMVGCDCAVCSSDDPRNKRTRSSLLLEKNNTRVLIDTPPELRMQLVRERIGAIDAVIITHSHADHVMGLDDLRRITELTGHAVPVYAQPPVQEDIRRIFRYAFTPPEQAGGGLPSFDLRDAPETLSIGDLILELLPVFHGRLPVLAVKCQGLAYLTDVNDIPPEAAEKLQGLDTLILDATRLAPHPSHFHLDRAVEIAMALNPGRTYLTHLSHDYDYAETNRRLPERIELSYDGLKIGLQGNS